MPFDRLPPERQGWLVRTGCRYIWAQPPVVAARKKLYANLEAAGAGGEAAVVQSIADVMRQYFTAFRLAGTLDRIDEAMARLGP